ncbi:MAG: lysophospholipid acyltransferase family protein [Xanthobacteraceae bacterium]
MRRLLDPVVLRSLIFNIVFYVSVVLWVLAAVPTAIMPRRAVLAVAKTWGRYNLWLLRVICGIDVEWRGRAKIPPGPLLVASKHQSFWETFALLHLFDDPTFILKRELMRIPVFGWLMAKAGMIPIDRSAGRDALTAMTTALRKALADGRQVVIFPEGTRRPPAAEPDYKLGIVFLYLEGDVPCLPVALNSGLYWARRGFLRYPGTIRVQFLDPIPPGLNRRVFFKRLRTEIETATAALVAEGERETGRASERGQRPDVLRKIPPAPTLPHKGGGSHPA